MKKSGIYLIRNIENGKVYVGSTCSTYGFNKRWTSHKHFLNNNKHQNKHLQYSWNKYGEDSFEFSILEECGDSMLEIREQAWMDYHNSMNQSFGYNLAYANRHILTEEHKRKIGIACKGIKHSKESVERARQKLLGRKFSKEHCKALSLGQLNSKHPKSDTNINHCKDLAIKNKKEIMQFTKDGSFIRNFDSAKDASKTINCFATVITRCLKGKSKTAHGYKWKYSNMEDVHKVT